MESAFRYTIPSDWAGNPDKYIKRGDVVCCKFAGILEHAGVYLGNGQIAHVSGHGGGKEASVARKGNLLGDFVDKNSDSITIVYYALRVRSREDIARAAEAYVGQYFRAGEYHLLHRNCLNFAALCAIGIE